MKKLLIICALFLVEMSAFSQTESKDESNSGKFSARSGTLLETRKEELGKVADVELKICHTKDVMKKDSISYVSFSLIIIGKYSADGFTGMLDEDELDGAIKSIDYILQNATLYNATKNYSYSFVSRGGWTFGAYTYKNSWSIYFKIEKYKSGSSVDLTI